MGCEKLYLKDMSVLGCGATVLACTLRGDGTYDVETDRTTLFPEGGGQLSDVGVMNDVRILHCHEENGTVLHQVESSFEPGETVQIEADRKTRLVHTQQHTGEHLLSFSYAKLFGAENVGFHMSDEVVTIDLDRELTDAQIAEGETFANELVWADREVRIFTADASGLAELPLRKKNEKLSGAVRIVEIEGGEMCTCCGTHFKGTAQVGLIKVLEHTRYKQGCRITFVCGALALRRFDAENRELRKAASRLSVKPDGVYEALVRKEEQLTALNITLKEKDCKVAELYTKELLNGIQARKGFKLVTANIAVDFDTCKMIAENICKAKDLFTVLFCEENGRYRYICMAGENCPVNCRNAAREINEMLGAKGGGNPKTAQGSFPKTPETERKLAELCKLSEAL